MSKRDVLVTGGFGALGINLVRALQARGDYRVTVVDNLSSGVVNYATDVEFIHLDITNAERVERLFRSYRPDLVFHLAAHFANQNSVDHPVSDTLANVVGTIQLLEAQRTNASLRKFVFASSSCVYGSAGRMEEEVPVAPWDTPYAINKHVGELYCRYYAGVHRVPTVCARIFNTYGPGELPGRYRNVIPNFIARALAGEDLVITGTGDETRDFTYVSDTVALLTRLGDCRFRDGEVFNGGTGRKTTIRELAAAVIDATGSSSRITFAPRRTWDHVADRCADTTKATADLGYEAQVPLPDGLARTVAWLRPHLAAARQPTS